MTIEELQELKVEVEIQYSTEIFGRIHYDPIGEKLISLIDEKISQLSVTDEDVKEAIEWLNRVKANALNMLDWENDLDLVDGYKTDIKKVETILQQMDKEPCEWCGGDGIPCLGVIDSIYCCRCGRKLR